MNWVILALTVLPLLQGTLAEQCGSQAGGALCPGGLCCSQFGWCDDTSEHCNEGCQSQCTPSEVGDISTLITQSTFNEMLKQRNDAACPASGFYTYDAFINAANSFPAFATSGDDATRKREIAAFLAETSHETTGGWPTAPDGPYAWGYCHKKELNPQSDYCQPNPTYPCAPGQKYYGRGPIQLSWNYNYGPCGQALGVNLLSNPDLLENDSLLSFKSALWFWMTPQPPKPSPHDVITGQWTPTPSDQAAGRVPGYGLITNIINGGLECGQGPNEKVKDRIGFYKRYCDILGVGYGSNLDCYNQQPYPPGLLVNAM